MVLSELSYNKRAINMSFVTAPRPEVAKAQHSLVLIELRLIFSTMTFIQSYVILPKKFASITSVTSYKSQV